MKDLENLTGQLLISMPNTTPGPYRRSVMLVTGDWYPGEGNLVGCTSSVLNRVSDTGATMSLVMRNFSLPAQDPNPIFIGGQDEPNRMYFIHTLDWQCASTKHLTKDIGLTAEAGILTAIAAGNGPEHWRCMFGHRAVRQDAVRAEINGDSKEHKWMMIPATVESVFHTMSDEQWLNAINTASKLEVASWF